MEETDLSVAPMAEPVEVSPKNVTPKASTHILLLSPLEIHFSQARIRSEFQDGRCVEEAAGLVEVVPLSQRGGLGPAAADGAVPAAAPDSAAEAAGEAPGAGVLVQEAKAARVGSGMSTLSRRPQRRLGRGRSRYSSRLPSRTSR